MNVSSFFGKKIVSTKGKTGYVVSVNGNGGKIECLVCADADEKEFYVDIRNVVSVGDKIVYDDRESVMKASVPIRLGRAGFDEKGKYLGEVEDFEFKGTNLLKAKIGKKNYPAKELVYGDVIIVKGAKKLKSDVIKDGQTVFKKGTVITPEVIRKAEELGEYVQLNLKSL